MGHGLWVMGHGSWVMGYGSYLPERLIVFVFEALIWHIMEACDAEECCGTMEDTLARL